jgi:hypothetical protein
MRRYIKNTKKLVKNTLLIFVLGILLIAAYYLLGLNSNPFVYYATIIIAIIFGLHLWLIVISLHLNHRKE